MSLSSGTRLGPYEILAPLGAGGMGEVYRATDTRLKRQVAIKILPAALAADPDRLARFQREAEVLASLNNAHIAAIYGLEDAPPSGSGQPGVKALVMELVEGPTLAERIAEGKIAIDEAIPIATQIARALEAAHERGIIHRDLKPANIKLRDDGPVKVLDFGLAKLTDTGISGVGRGDPSQSPTIADVTAMTGMGVILGTAAYMSPEQARGRAVDKRTDVWAFGAVLYEMLTGRRAFPGDDIAETIAAVLKSTPDWSALPADVPPNVLTLIQRCLDKDKNTRIGDMAVARFLLEGGHTSASGLTAPAATTSATAVARPADVSRRWTALPWAVAALVIGAAIGWLLPRRSTTAPLVTHLQMSVLPAENLVVSLPLVRPSLTAMAIAPDGRTIVFAATRNKVTQLYARAFDRAEATAITGTEDAVAPFFSPDGAWIGFWTADKIKKVPLGGGAVATICDLPNAATSSASWADDGSIFFANRATVSKVPAAGGTPAAVVTGDASKSERLIQVHALPGAKAILVTSMFSFDWATATLAVHSIDGSERRVLMPGVSDARYVNSGHLVYVKAGTLMGVPFDAQSRQITGTPAALVEGVMHAMNAPNRDIDTGAGQFAVSASGTLVYVVGGLPPMFQDTFVWIDRKGAVQGPAPAAAGPYLGPRLSPDGQKLAVALRGEGRGPDLWVFDILRGAPTRLTFNGGNWPVWSPDGKRIVYSQAVNGVNNLHLVEAGGGKPERLLTSTDAGQTPMSWSRTANAIAFLQRTKPGAEAIWVLPMEGDKTPRVFVESSFALWHAEFSPDGRLIAYASNESGEYEVYVQPYPGPGDKTRISTAGGTEPLWTPDGRELLYRSGTADRQQFFSAAIRSLSPFRVDPPRLLFDDTPVKYDSTAPGRSWNISADGQRFLLSQFVPSTDRPVTTMHVVLNWTEELKRQAPQR